PHGRHLLGELCRRGRPGTEEAVAVPDGAPQRVRMAGAEPDRGVGLLERFGLHSRVLQLPEPPVEVDPLFCPESLHQPQPLVELGHQAGGVDLESGKHPAPPSRADADLEPTPAQLVQRAQALGQVHRAVQRGDEHHAAQAYALGAGGRVGHGLEGTEVWHRAEGLLQRPGAFEAERLGSRHVGPETSGIELSVRKELRDGDRKSHVLAPVSSIPPNLVVEAVDLQVHAALGAVIADHEHKIGLPPPQGPNGRRYGECTSPNRGISNSALASTISRPVVRTAPTAALSHSGCSGSRWRLPSALPFCGIRTPALPCPTLWFLGALLSQCDFARANFAEWVGAYSRGYPRCP